VSSLHRLVAVAATLDQTGLVERLTAVLAPTEITDQCSNLGDAEDWMWCVVGVAARMGDLVWFDREHCCVARHADAERVHWAQPVVLK
jgi:hypothetical protein